MGYMDYFQQTSQLVFRVETDYKLNLIKNDKSSLISTQEVNKPEVHFIACESVVDEYPKGIQSYLKSLSLMFRSPQMVPMDRKFKIVDFDHFMKGNPHECYYDDYDSFFEV